MDPERPKKQVCADEIDCTILVLLRHSFLTTYRIAFGIYLTWTQSMTSSSCSWNASAIINIKYSNGIACSSIKKKVCGCSRFLPHRARDICLCSMECAGAWKAFWARRCNRPSAET